MRMVLIRTYPILHRLPIRLLRPNWYLLYSSSGFHYGLLARGTGRTDHRFSGHVYFVGGAELWRRYAWRWGSAGRR